MLTLIFLQPALPLTLLFFQKKQIIKDWNQDFFQLLLLGCRTTPKNFHLYNRQKMIIFQGTVPTFQQLFILINVKARKEWGGGGC